MVSYRHLSGLLAFYGEDGITSTVGPLAVDGLMVMATGALLATRPGGTGQARPVGQRRAPAATATDTAPVSRAGQADTPRRRPVRTARPDTGTRRGQPDAAGGHGRAGGRAADAHPDMATADIAARLGVSDRTVRRHLARHLAHDTTTRTDAEEVPA